MAHVAMRKIINDARSLDVIVFVTYVHPKKPTAQFELNLYITNYMYKNPCM